MVSESQRSGLDPDTWVWRYMDLWKFVTLIDTQSLYFCSAARMPDTWEGGLSEQTLAERPIKAQAVAEHLQSTGLPGWTSEDVVRVLEYGNKTARDHIMMNCWHIGNVESAAMWDLYCRDADGVALRSTVGCLESCLPELEGDSAITVRPVTYRDYGKVAISESNIFHPFTSKRESYSHERELRAMFFTRESPDGVNVSLDLLGLIAAVYVPPQAPDWHLRVVETLTDRYGLPVDVNKSALDDPAVH